MQYDELAKARSASPAQGIRDAMWAELKDHLESARRAILEEIRHYPPPIAACDQQFNHLLEQRDRISGELGRLAAAREASARQQAEVDALDDFIAASPCLDAALKARLIAELKRCRLR
jgi:hypothetical protein